MDKLNDKVKTGRSQAYQDAQVVGITGRDIDNNVMRAIESTTTGELKVAVSSHLVDSPDMKARTNIADPATSTFLKCDGSGILSVKEVGTVNVAPANSTNSAITDAPANSVAVGLKARTDKSLASSETFLLCDSQGHLQVDLLNQNVEAQLAAFTDINNVSSVKRLLCDADGHLQVDIVSGGGGGGTSTHTVEQQSAPTGSLQIIGDGNGNQYIDTNGGSKFVVVVQTGDGSGSPVVSVEWSDNTSFSVNQVFICNGFSTGFAQTAPITMAGTSRVDSTTLTTQAILQYDTIPARYARITVRQTSGSSITYTGKTTLSP